MLRLWNFIKGSVTILVSGYYVERFINVCIHRRILLWNIQRNPDNSIEMNINIKGFKMLQEIAEKTSCNFKVIKKNGLRFILGKYRKRKAFALGFAIFIAVFAILNSFIWSIDIYGVKNSDKQELIDTLFCSGITLGKIKYNIDAENAADMLITKVKGLAWVSIVIKGTRVRVEIAEATPKPKVFSSDACNIVAKRDGIIKSIYARSGQEMVKEGDTVVKGQVLISGDLAFEDSQSEKTLVYARGTVKARTWHEKNVEVISKIVTKQRSGIFKDNMRLVLFSKELKILNREIDFKDYDRIELNKRLKISKNIVFPFGINIERYYENISTKTNIPESQAKKLAMEQACKEIVAEISPDSIIISKDIKFIKKNNDILYANVIIECVEEIGKEMPIVITEEKK